MRVHKLVIDSWPTPDGKPFADVDEQVWVDAVEYWSNGAAQSGAWPEWLPAGLDLSERIQPDDFREPWGPPPGYWVGGSECILVVPNAPRRTHYFSKPAAQRVLDQLAEWGVVGHIESSEPITWAVAS